MLRKTYYYVLLSILSLNSYYCIWPLDFTASDPDVKHNLSELIRSKGYPVENSHVQTEDGYILQLTHISHGKNERTSKGQKPAVLLMHGMFAAPGQWTANFQNDSLAFILADAGYDVWMGCARGCPFSMKHTTLLTDSKRFWDFSWDEIGTKDLPAFIDNILKRTGQSKLYYIGHSMGTTASFVLLSLRPEYNQKIRVNIALAPVAYVAHTTGISKFYLPMGRMFDRFVHTVSYGKVTFSPLIRKAVEVFCGTELSMMINCDLLLNIGLGFGSAQQFNQSRFPVYVEHVLGAASTKQVAHYSQSSVGKGFARFDYGPEENKKKYGQSMPPQYPLEKITSPVALFSSKEDYFADPDDVRALKARLPNVVEDFIPNFKPWTHLDFVLAMQGKKYLYDQVLKVMKKF